MSKKKPTAEEAQPPKCYYAKEVYIRNRDKQLLFTFHLDKIFFHETRKKKVSSSFIYAMHFIQVGVVKLHVVEVITCLYFRFFFASRFFL